MVDLPKFNELPASVRRSPRLRWNLIADLLTGVKVYNPETKKISEVGLSTSEPVEEQQTRDIHIDVDDGTDGVEGATVVIGETSKTTGSAGGCNFTGLSDGEYQVTVTAEGFVEKTETINVSENDTTFTISLTAVEAPGE